MHPHELPSCLLPLRTVDAPRGHLVCIHPGWLAVHHYQALADAMPGWSIHVVEIGLCPQYWQAPAGEGGVDRRADDLVDHIVDALCSRFPAAPIVLSGWSFGGVIAHAVAGRWPLPGQIKALAMLDSIAPRPGVDLGRVRRARRVSARWFVQYFNAHKGCSLRLPWWRPIADEQVVLRFLHRQALRQGAVQPGTSYQGFRKLFTGFTDGLARNGRLAAGLTARHFGGPALLFRARRGLLRRFMLFRHMGWGSLTTRLELSTVPFDHYTVLTDAACVRAIGERIARAAGGSAPQPRTLNRPPKSPIPKQ